MKKVLDKPPLVHAVIHLRFSDVPALTAASPELLNSLHVSMIEEGFSEHIESQAELVDVMIDSATQQVRQRKESRKRYLYRAAGERDIFEITQNTVVLKTTDYKTFEKFSNTFKRLLCICSEVIVGLEKALLKSIGLRYVDVIAPSNGKELREFISEDILPANLRALDGRRHIHGFTAKQAETAPGQTIRVGFEELPCNERRVHKVLPDNLLEADNRCALLISGHNEWLNVSGETYGILDVDHIKNFIGSPKFSVESVVDSLAPLYDDANKVFWNAISADAKSAWGYREVDNVD
ncbi:TIGR04255 family protein [Marinobacter nauticus]|uniref:TIGR04255 family protein n=1 Tax=Marinobacter nauticus TaxID=2743 RepID=UPI00112FA143|nr:TIGR04255 family protein [Marinobacter nauticus]TPW22178.1 TIGR04255 family protein [Marinobacter nauticus]